MKKKAKWIYGITALSLIFGSGFGFGHLAKKEKIIEKETDRSKYWKNRYEDYKAKSEKDFLEHQIEQNRIIKEAYGHCVKNV